MDHSQENILFMLHLPLLVHGYSLVGELVNESKVINKNYHGGFINLILSRQVDESGKTNIRKLFRFMFIWFHLLGKLIHYRPDLCFYALTTIWSGLKKDALLISLLRLFRVRIVCHIHNKGIVESRKKRINNALYRFVFRDAHVILLSKHLYYDTEDYAAKEFVCICPNGIKDYQPDTAFLSHPENKLFKILFLSKLIEEKDVFAMPSCYDCFPLVVLEAMQYCLPVITAYEGGVPDMIEERVTGFLMSRYDDAEELASKLEYPIQNPQMREKMGANGRIKYEEDFTLPIFEKGISDILSKILINKPFNN